MWYTDSLKYHDNQLMSVLKPFAINLNKQNDWTGSATYEVPTNKEFVN
jgi:hypothetical protein